MTTPDSKDRHADTDHRFDTETKVNQEPIPENMEAPEEPTTPSLLGSYQKRKSLFDNGPNKRSRLFAGSGSSFGVNNNRYFQPNVQSGNRFLLTGGGNYEVR